MARKKNFSVLDKWPDVGMNGAKKDPAFAGQNIKNGYSGRH